MRSSRTIRRIAAFAAAFGITLQALWPLVAQAGPRDSISVPVCSAEGSHRSIDLPIGNPHSGKGAEHCMLCLLGGERPAVLDLPDVLAFLCGASEQEVVFSAQIPQASLAPYFARSRAPPASL